MAEARKLKIFVASPSDVQEERETLVQLVAEINDTLAYLVPEKGLTLELVRSETHSYPDLGSPQDVIDREIPCDYDIFVGVMWKRAGTPTAQHSSGTISEFRRACERRKNSSLPRIMFYFCEQPIPVPTAMDIEQLRAVVTFKAELQAQGLTSSYPSHSQFGEHVRGGLLRAIRDILRESGQVVPSDPAAPPVDEAACEEAQDLAKEFEQIRHDMPSCVQRTALQKGIFSNMKALAPKVRGNLVSFEQSDSSGNHLMAIAILNMFPSSDHLDWLVERIDRKNGIAFAAYNSAVALVEAVSALPADCCVKLRIAIDKAKTLADPNHSDHLRVLARAEKELARKCGST